MILFLSIFLLHISSALCILTPSLINQDPISAVPGEIVKVVFQLTGTENPECGTINLEFLEQYPFTLDPSYSRVQTIKGGTYQRDFNSFWIIPYKVRVDSNALDGDQKLSLKTEINSDSQLAKITDFNITVEEVRTDFIITLDSYSFSTNKLTIGVVNIGKKTAQAITAQIPKQDNVLIEGGNIKILGDLDSTEDTTVTFDAVLSSGPIAIDLEYNDKIGERRKISKEIFFNDIDFESTRERSSISVSSILLWLVVVAIVIYLFIVKRRREHHKSHIQKFHS